MSTTSPRTDEDAARRTKAATRSWLCPGAGFALVGRKKPALATYGVTLSILPATIWLAYHPGAAALFAVAGVVVVGFALWIWEQSNVRDFPLAPAAPALLTGGFFLATAVLWLSSFAAIGMFMTSFGSLRMAGGGMAPTLEHGQRAIYYKQAPSAPLRPGDLVFYRNAWDSGWGESGWLVVSRVMAVPGDRLSTQHGRYLVNGMAGIEVAAAGPHRVTVPVPASPEWIVVPKGSYFVSQDSPATGSTVGSSRGCGRNRS